MVAWMQKCLQFHPIRTCDAHAPVGEVNEFRSKFYAQYQECRLRRMAAEGVEPLTVDFDGHLLAHAELSDWGEQGEWGRSNGVKEMNAA